jgi:protein TonB
MSITLRWMTSRMLPVAASLLLHAVACGAIAMLPPGVYSPESVLLADLVPPDPSPPAPRKAVALEKAEPPKTDRRPLKPPTPIETPMPKIPETPPEAVKEVEEPPAPVAAPPRPPITTPAPTVPVPAATPAAEGAPAAPAGRGPLAPADAPLTPAGDGLPTQAGPAAPARPAPTVAALPPDAVTKTAIPRGGYQVRPPYPASARRAGIQGTTLLGVLIGADGRVGEVVVRQSAGHPDLDAAAADAVKRWRFEPARRGSEPVAMWVLLPVEFRLR